MKTEMCETLGRLGREDEIPATLEELRSTLEAPVVDLRRRFGLEMTDHTRASRIVVVEIADQVVGIVVDGVSEVLRVNDATIEPPSPVVAGIESEYIQGIAKLPERLVILLDLDRVLAREERRVLETVV